METYYGIEKKIWAHMEALSVDHELEPTSSSTKALSTLSFLEASVFPLPVDPLLLAMGFSKPKKSLYYAFLTTFFSVLGAMGGYLIAFLFGQLFPHFFSTLFLMKPALIQSPIK